MRTWTARPAVAADREAWVGLFAGYCDFYNLPSTAAQREQAWSWIEAGTIHCLLAVPADPPEGDAEHADADAKRASGAARPGTDAAVAPGGASAYVASPGGEAVGLAHVRPVPSPLRGAFGGYLDDLFVDPAVRGDGVFEVLMGAVRDLAAAEDWLNVRWITAADNFRAQAAYDRVSTRTEWVTYQLDL